MRKYWLPLFIGVFAVSFIFGPASVSLAEEAAAGEEKPKVQEPVETTKGITFNFEGWDLKKAVEYLARVIEKPVIYSDGLTGTINYVSFVPIPKENVPA